MHLSPRARAFVSDIRSVGAPIPFGEQDETFTKLVERLVSYCSRWKVGGPSADSQHPWDVVLTLHKLKPHEVPAFGWLIDRVIAGVNEWTFSLEPSEPSSVRIVGLPAPRPQAGTASYELAVFGPWMLDTPVAVIQAVHFNQITRFISALTEDTDVVDAIGRAGMRVTTSKSVEFEAGELRYELSLNEVSGVPRQDK